MNYLPVSVVTFYTPKTSQPILDFVSLVSSLCSLFDMPNQTGHIDADLHNSPNALTGICFRSPGTLETPFGQSSRSPTPF